MPSLLRNVLAVIVGLLLGSVVNGSLIALSPSLIPPPAGVDVNSVESMRANIGLFQPRNFLMPFLAHALGTLVGAVAAYLVAVTHRARFAYAIGVIFLCGGIAACFMIPAPTWFIAVDLLFAYVPMAWLAIQIGSRMQPGSAIPWSQIA